MIAARRNSAVAGLLMFTGQTLDVVSLTVLLVLFPAAIVAEVHPVISGIYLMWGLGALLLFKIGIPAIVCWYMTEHPVGRMLRLVVYLAALSGFIGAASNIYALVTLWSLR
jgi:hypothetical protein